MPYFAQRSKEQAVNRLRSREHPKEIPGAGSTKNSKKEHEAEGKEQERKSKRSREHRKIRRSKKKGQEQGGTI